LAGLSEFLSSLLCTGLSADANSALLFADLLKKNRCLPKTENTKKRNDNLSALDGILDAIVFLEIVPKIDILKNQGFHKYSFDNICGFFVSRCAEIE
jgi:hypothetical protein